MWVMSAFSRGRCRRAVDARVFGWTRGKTKANVRSRVLPHPPLQTELQPTFTIHPALGYHEVSTILIDSQIVADLPIPRFKLPL